MQFHPVADIFPLMAGAEFEALVDDIKSNGLRIPVVLHPDGRILDGRNRFRACQQANRSVTFETWAGDPGTEVAFVVSLNLTRRHLDESQRAMVAARIEAFGHGGSRSQDANLHLDREAAAALVNVSPRSVASGSKVLDDGAPELIAAVERGDVAVSTAAVLADVPKEEQREIVAKGEREILEVAKKIRAARLEDRRKERVKKLADIAAGNTDLKTDAKFPILYADPPWRYEHVETESRAIENQYPTMALDDICALPVGGITTDDAVLFLWATSPKLAEAMRVVEAWGFNYRTSMVWVKEQLGMGYYARQRHELLLICTKGSPPTPAPSDRPDSVVTAPRGRHSEKPEAFYGLIEQMYPTLPKIELFSRSPREGWGAWGNQAA